MAEIEDSNEELQDPGAPGDESVDELLEQAQLNAQSAIMATVAFLKQNDIDIDSWTRSLGETFSLAWDDPSNKWEAGEFLEAMLVNFRALGAVATEIEMTADRASAVLEDFPNLELTALFGVEPTEVARFIDTALPIARARGLTWEWLSDGEKIRLLVRRGDE